MIRWFAQTARGLCMGIADVIPGVSGGTLALILGIYERLIAAVSSIGWGMLKAVFSRELWRRLVKGLKEPGAEGDDEVGTYASNLLFLAFLGLGIATALAVGARFIPTLLDLYPAQMKGFFLGLVLASVVVPFRLMKQKKAAYMVGGLLAAVATFFVLGIPQSHTGTARGSVTLQLASPAAQETRLTRDGTVFLTHRHEGQEKREVAFGPAHDVTIPAGADRVEVPIEARMRGAAANLAPGELVDVKGVENATIIQAAPTTGGDNPAIWYVFLAGMIAISAMVLPGISGSFILLLLGMYHYVTYTLRAALYDRDPDALLIVGVLLAAFAVGILLFSRFLNWLLEHYHDATMAVLIGIMVGSLRKLWPWTATDADGLTTNVFPDGFDATVGLTLGLFAAGAVIVVLLERFGRSRGTVTA